MLLNELKKLKSGTDVRGVAVGDRSPVTLTDEAVTLISKAFCKWLSGRSGKKRIKIAVGNDSRITASHIAGLVKDAILTCGCDVIYTGLSSTPSMFMLLKKSDFGCDGAVMITASHLPYDRNGLKFFTPQGGLDGDDIDDILSLAAAGTFPCGKGNCEERSYLDDYCKLLTATVENACGKLPLAGKKIIVDAGNGAGGFFVDKVLKPLGADTEGSQFLEPDGRFPNHIPNPEDKAAIDGLSKAVLACGADLGIIFDTDVDRAACVDKSGREINRNALIALLSAILLKERAGVIVTDSVTSDHLTQFIEKSGGRHLRYMRGYRNVIDKCIELNEKGIYSPLAIETSGHAAFKDNYFLDDGAYLITRILICKSQIAKQGLNLSDLIADLGQPVEEDEIRISFSPLSKDFREEGNRVIEELKENGAMRGAALTPENYEGARFNFDKDRGDGWLLIRRSVHDPVLPINIESDSAGGNLKMAKALAERLKIYDFLDLTNLNHYISSKEK